MAVKKRMKGDARKVQIVDIATKLARKGHYSTVTRDQIANKAGVCPSIVHHFFGTMGQLRTAVVRRAVKAQDAAVVAQALGMKDKHVRKLADTDPDLYERAKAEL